MMNAQIFFSKKSHFLKLPKDVTTSKKWTNIRLFPSSGANSVVTVLVSLASTIAASEPFVSSHPYFPSFHKRTSTRLLMSREDYQNPSLIHFSCAPSDSGTYDSVRQLRFKY